MKTTTLALVLTDQRVREVQRLVAHNIVEFDKGVEMATGRNETFAHALQLKGVTAPCPRCGHPHFSIVGETAIDLKGGGLLNLGEQLPAVVVGCNNCGFLTMKVPAEDCWSKLIPIITLAFGYMFGKKS